MDACNKHSFLSSTVHHKPSDSPKKTPRTVPTCIMSSYKAIAAMAQSLTPNIPDFRCFPPIILFPMLGCPAGDPTGFRAGERRHTKSNKPKDDESTGRVNGTLRQESTQGTPHKQSNQRSMRLFSCCSLCSKFGNCGNSANIKHGNKVVPGACEVPLMQSSLPYSFISPNKQTDVSSKDNRARGSRVLFSRVDASSSLVAILRTCTFDVV